MTFRKVKTELISTKGKNYYEPPSEREVASVRAGRSLRVRTQNTRLVASANLKCRGLPPYAASGVFPPPGGGLNSTPFILFCEVKNEHQKSKRE